MSTQSVRIAIVGDRDESVTAHRAIPHALALVARATGVKVEGQWLGTETIPGDPEIARRWLAPFTGIWCVPATPYRNTEGALAAIHVARTGRVPFLGTCGGFQHAAIEAARDLLGWSDAAHAETDPNAARPVIVPLACSLVEKTGTVHFVPGSRVAAAYGRLEAAEGYHCRYGINPEVRAALDAVGLHVTATDDDGDVRAFELDGHPFFVGTLFQPERAALRDETPPLVEAFVRAVAIAGAARAATRQQAAPA